MNYASQTLAALLLSALSFVSAKANAQATPTFSAAYPLAYMDVDVVRVLTRPPDVNNVYPIYFVLSAPFVASGPNSLPCLNPANSVDNNRWAVIHSSRADHKVIRETFQVAYTLNKRVRAVNGVRLHYSDIIVILITTIHKHFQPFLPQPPRQ